MKLIPPVALATWMLEHLTFGSPNESLSGDLLEELRAGRSAVWYWRQALSATALSLSGNARAYLLPLVFSAGWSTLYPALWPAIVRSLQSETLLQRIATRDWPYSTSLHFVGATLPSILFVWSGFFAYRIASHNAASRLSTLRLLGSLSLGLNVLFIATIGQRLSGSGMDTRIAAQPDLRSPLVALSLPLALSLFSALTCALPPRRRQPRSAGSLPA
jgi:hypothetical protein